MSPWGHLITVDSSNDSPRPKDHRQLSRSPKILRVPEILKIFDCSVTKLLCKIENAQNSRDRHLSTECPMFILNTAIESHAAGLPFAVS